MKTKDVKYVRYVIDLDNPPPLTESQKAELAALAARSDGDIDFSDIPELTADFFKNAKPLREILASRKKPAE